MVVTGGGHDRAGRGGRPGGPPSGIARTTERRAPWAGGGRSAVVWRSAGYLLAGGALIWGVLSLVGYGITRTSAGSPIRSADAGIARWWADQRTPQLNTLTDYGTTLSDTLTAIAVTAVVVVAFAALRRWRDALTVYTAIQGELLVFLAVTATVGRARPPVPHLDEAPPTSSFPSGHTAAAVALYGCLAYLLLRSAVNRVLAVPVAVVLCLIPFVVAISRMYRGMHYLSDVIFGFLGGGCWLLLTLYVLAATPAVHDQRRRA